MIPPEFSLEEEDSIDIRKWLILIYKNKFFILLSILIALPLAALYNKVASPAYEVFAKVLVRESSNPLDKEELFKISLVSDPYRLENEKGILTSSGLISKTLRELDFYTEYFKRDRLSRTELYHSSPFTVLFDTNHVQPLELSFDIKIFNDSTFGIKTNGKETYLYNFSTYHTSGKYNDPNYHDTVFFGESIELPFAKFKLVKKNIWNNTQVGEEYTFRFKSLKSLVSKYKDALKIDIQSKSSILTISLRDKNTLKAELFLRKLLANFLYRGIEREDEIAERTINFIDFQLLSLVDSLRLSEELLEDYRSENKLVDIDIQTEKVYERQSDLEKQEAALIMQMRYLEYLRESLTEDTLAVEKILTPSTMGITDAVLNNLVLELVELHNEMTEVTLNSRRVNPYIESISSKIGSVKQKLGETVENLIHATQISLEEIDIQTATTLSKLSSLPQEQGELLKYERNFQLNDEIYTFLITKRSEMQIKLASNIPANEILEEADRDYARKVMPNKKANILIGFAIGILFPFILIYIRNTFNDRIQSSEDILYKDNFPLIGTINHDTVDEIPALVYHPESMLAESYRMLRANMQFMLSSDSSPVVLFTSAMKGEGKSFNAINFAAVCASYGKKVCLLDLDLRRPKIASYLGVESEQGMSNLLIDRLKIADAIFPVCNGLFDIIPSGPIPPNPSELIDSGRLEYIFDELKKKYDRIIIDTPPIGIISDSVFICKYATATLMIVRHNVTSKKLLGSVLKDFKRNNLKGVSIIYNDLPNNQGNYYRGNSKYYYYSQEKRGLFRFKT